MKTLTYSLLLASVLSVSACDKNDADEAGKAISEKASEMVEVTKETMNSEDSTDIPNQADMDKIKKLTSDVKEF